MFAKKVDSVHRVLSQNQLQPQWLVMILHTDVFNLIVLMDIVKLDVILLATFV